jgi:poly-D-alanine transfer protein DltD
MSRGKYLSVEEAREQDKIKQFCKEHPSEGNRQQFDQLLDAMAKPKTTAKEPGA